MTKAGRYALVGAAIAVALLIGIYGYQYWSAPKYTESEHAEMNKVIAENCTKCLVQERQPCTADTIQHSYWGIICNVSYVKACNKACKPV